jgi:signal recognition particle receptor subunit beta
MAYKIIFTGPSGAGKSTAIQTLSDCAAINTDVAASKQHRHSEKTTTTVTFDYGFITLEDGEKIHLYGTPGQVRFDYMWPILSKGALGVVILIDASSTDPLHDLHEFLEYFKHLISTAQLVIGITCLDLSSKTSLHDYQDIAYAHNHYVPIFEVDARVKDDLIILLQALLFSLGADDKSVSE